MGREPRVFEPGAIYHLTTHGVGKSPIFGDDLDRQHFIHRLSRVARGYGWHCYAACLMNTHYHLVVSSRDGTISPGMRELNGGHSRTFNTRYLRRGALFEARYAHLQIRNDEHLLEAIRYVALNPVRARMVKAPVEWTWSTYGQLIGMREPWPAFDPGLVLAHFSADANQAVSHVRAFVEQRV